MPETQDLKQIILKIQDKNCNYLRHRSNDNEVKKKGGR